MSQDPIREYARRVMQQEGDTDDPLRAYARRTLAQREGGRGIGETLLDIMRTVHGQRVPDPNNPVGRAAGGVGSFIEDANRVAELLTPGGATTWIEAARGNPEAQADIARLPVFAAGMAEGGVIDPAEAVLGIPGMLTRLVAPDVNLPTDKAADWVARLSAGMKNSTEDLALMAGLSEEDINNAYLAGNFVGFTLPIVGSIKMASMALRTGQSVGQAMTSGAYSTDFVAGLIFGGLLQPGEGEERLENMLWESAAFGAMRVLLMFGPVAKALRHDRAARMDVTNEVLRILEDAENGLGIDPARLERVGGVSAVAQILQEEDYISHSLTAQRLFEAREYDLALVQAIKDVSRSRGTGGVVRLAGTEWQDVSARIERMRAQFPGLKFEAVKRPAGTRNVTTEPSPGVLTDAEGNRFMERPGKVNEEVRAIRTPDGRVLDNRNMEGTHIDLFQKAGAVDGSFARFESGSLDPDGNFLPFHPKFHEGKWAGRTAPIKGGTRQVEDTAYDIFFGTRGLSNKQRRELARFGRFSGQEVHYGAEAVEYVGPARTKKGEIREGWVAIKREGSEKPVVVKEENVSDLPYFKESTPVGPEYDTLYRNFSDFEDESLTRIIEARGAMSERQLIDAVRNGTIRLNPEDRRAFELNALIYQEELGITAEDLVTGVSMIAADGTPRLIHRNVRRGTPEHFKNSSPDGMEGPWRLTEMDANGRPVGHTSYSTLQEAIETAELHGMQIEDVVQKFPSADDMAQLISSTGLQHADILQPRVATSFEEVFDIWARERGIDPMSADYESMRIYFAQRRRREMWETVDDETKKVWTELRKEYDALTENQNFSLEQIGAQKSFHVERMDDGRVLLRQMDTGLTFRVGSERVARDLLKQVTNVDKDITALLHTGGHGMADWSRGLPVPETIQFDEAVMSMEGRAALPLRFLRNNRDWMISVENSSDIPLFTKGFDKVNKGQTQMLTDMEPYAVNLRTAWKGIKVDRRREIADFWREAEDLELDLRDAVKLFKDRGMSVQEISAVRRTVAIADDLFARHTDIDPKRYVKMYFSRIRPQTQKAGGRVDVMNILEAEGYTPRERQFWAEMTRTGDMAVVEMDPEIIMHKYIRSVFFEKHVKKDWNEMLRLIEMRFRDLPDEIKARKLSEALPGTTDNSFVLPDEVRTIVSEYLMAVRGDLTRAGRMARGFSEHLLKRLGVHADPRVLEHVVNSWMSAQYGAAMGLRPVSIARNMTQTLWLLQPRLGSRHGGRALEKSVTREGYEEARRVGAIPAQEATVPSGDVVMEHIEAGTAVATRDALTSHLFAGAVNKSMRAARTVRNWSRGSLVTYASSDHASRAWGYFWQKMHTDEWLTKFERGRISWEKFDEEGLAFFAPPLKKEFRDIYNHMGKEEALQYIGRQATNEVNFIYGMGAQVPWMQTIPGRMVGMFGTWPLWAIEAYMRPLRYANKRQMAKFYGRTAAFTLAFANMGLQMGVDMWSWIAPTSALTWAGGPPVEHGINMREVVAAPWDRKAGAFKRMAFDMASLIVPGQIAFHDAMRSSALAADNPDLAVLSMMLGRPLDDPHVGLDYLYNPKSALAEPRVSPETYKAMQENDGINWLNTIDLAPDTAAPAGREPEVDILQLMTGGQ